MNIPSIQYKGHALRAYSQQQTFLLHRVTVLHQGPDRHHSNRRTQWPGVIRRSSKGKPHPSL